MARTLVKTESVFEGYQTAPTGFDFAASGTPVDATAGTGVLVAQFSQGFTSVTQIPGSPVLPGISFQPLAPGIYEVTCSLTQGSPPGVNAYTALSLIDGNSVVHDGATSSTAVANNSVISVVMTALMNITSVASPVTIKVQGKGGAGSVQPGYTSPGTVNWKIKRVA